jgi:hypothetical protein
MMSSGPSIIASTNGTVEAVSGVYVPSSADLAGASPRFCRPGCTAPHGCTAPPRQHSPARMYGSRPAPKRQKGSYQQ